MTDEDNSNIERGVAGNELVDLEHNEDQVIITASIKGEPGYMAWVEGEYADLRASGESRWEAVYHLAVAKTGEGQ